MIMVVHVVGVDRTSGSTTNLFASALVAADVDNDDFIRASMS
jgi:hypothetical protein